MLSLVNEFVIRFKLDLISSVLTVLLLTDMITAIFQISSLFFHVYRTRLKFLLLVRNEKIYGYHIMPFILIKLLNSGIANNSNQMHFFTFYDKVKSILT